MLKVLLSGNILLFAYILITKFKLTLTAIFVVGGVYIVDHAILSQGMIISLWQDHTEITKGILFCIVSVDIFRFIMQIVKKNTKRALKMYFSGT